MSNPRGRKHRRIGLLFCAFVASATPLFTAASARADVPISEEARARFAAGVNLLKDPEGARYEEAYREFKAAYASSPSYKILGNLGLCAMKLERDDEAIQAYEKYLQDGGAELDPSVVQQVKTDLQTLKAGVANVTVSTNMPGATIIDVRVPVRGERITNAYGPFDKPAKLGIHQGTHIMTARLAGYPDVVWEFDTAGAHELPAHAFEFKAPEAKVTAPTDTGPRTVKTQERPIPTGVIVGGVATGVLLVGTAVTGVLALGKHSDFQTANDGKNAQKAQDLKDSGQTLNLVSDIMLGATVVAGAVTAVLFVTRPTVEVDSPAPPPAASGYRTPRIARSEPIKLVPTVGSHGGGLTVSGGLPWM